MPHNLSNAQKKARVVWSKEMLHASKHVYDIVTGDESWIYTYELERKQQSTIWVFQEEPNATKVVRARSTSKQMIICFSGKTGHVAIVPLEQCTIVNSEWSTIIFCQLSFKKWGKLTAEGGSLFTTTMRALHIGSSNCIFEHSKHLFDESSAV